MACLYRPFEDGVAHAPGAFAEHGHPPGIAAKGLDVSLDPFQGRDLVHQSVISQGLALPGGPCQGGMGEIAQGAEAVIDAHQDHPVLGEVCPVIDPARPRAVAAAVDPDHDRRALGAVGGVDIELETVLAHRAIGAAAVGAAVGVHGLDAGGADLDRVPLTGPGGRLGGRRPTQGPNRRRGEGDVAIDRHAVPGLARQDAGLDRDLGGLRLRGGCEGEYDPDQGNGEAAWAHGRSFRLVSAGGFPAACPQVKARFSESRGWPAGDRLSGCPGYGCRAERQGPPASWPPPDGKGRQSSWPPGGSRRPGSAADRERR